MAKVTVCFEEQSVYTTQIDVPDEFVENKDTDKIIDAAIEYYNKNRTDMLFNCLASFVSIEDEDLETNFTEF